MRGVVSEESPASWPLEALKAQAVAARSYGLATGSRGTVSTTTTTPGARSTGASRRRPPRRTRRSARLACRLSSTRQGRPDVLLLDLRRAYGEQRELLARLRPARDPLPARGRRSLRGRRRLAVRALEAEVLDRPDELGAPLGRPARQVEEVVVTQRGASPRIVRANLIGTGGTTTVNGPQLRTALGLPDTWAFFKKK